MKKSEFVKAVLERSCSLVNEEQVMQNLEIFLDLGMSLPLIDVWVIGTDIEPTKVKQARWESEDE